MLDPFGGAGTTALVAARLGRSATIIELNPRYCEIARRRIDAAARQQRMELVDGMDGHGLTRTDTDDGKEG